jgi:hypothetical protein
MCVSLSPRLMFAVAQLYVAAGTSYSLRGWPICAAQLNLADPGQLWSDPARSEQAHATPTHSTVTNQLDMIESHVSKEEVDLIWLLCRNFRVFFSCCPESAQ